MSSSPEAGPESKAAQSFALSGWVIVVVIAGALLMTAGALIALVRPAMLAPSGTEINEGVRVYAGYLFSRNLVVALMLVYTLFARVRVPLSSLLVVAGFIQLVDAIVDCAEGRWMLIPGVALLGALFLFAGARVAPLAHSNR